MPVRIVTDSNSDIPPDLVARHNLVVVPSIINMDGKSYVDGVDLTREEFYRRLPGLTTSPTTAVYSPLEFEAAYRSCGSDDVVAIHLSSTFSGIYGAARLGAEPLGDQVTVVDSRQVSMGMGWLVLAAAEAAEAGRSRPEVLEVVRSAQARVRLYAALDTIEYLRRGGRASLLQARLGELLQVKPILEVRDGAANMVARVRTRQKARDDLEARVKALGPLARLAVLHTNCPDEAQAMAERLAPLAQQPALVADVTAVIGVHVGPGTVAAAVLMVESSV